MQLVLDPNAYRLFMDGDREAVDLVQLADAILIPVPVIAELRFGFANGTRVTQNATALARFLDSPRVEVLSCDPDTAEQYAALKLQLKKQGTPIPINDIWIAALVLQHRGALFTRDRDFDRLPQLPRA